MLLAFGTSLLFPDRSKVKILMTLDLKDYVERLRETSAQEGYVILNVFAFN